MATEQYKQLARRIPLEVINQKKLAVFDEVVAPNGVDHGLPPGVPQTANASKEYLRGLLTSFPDLHYTIEDEVAEGDRVAQYMTAEATMTGDFQGMPASGRHARWSEIHIVRFEGNAIVEHWANVDQMGMMQQLGFMPAQPGT